MQNRVQNRVHNIFSCAKTSFPCAKTSFPCARMSFSCAKLSIVQSFPVCKAFPCAKIIFPCAKRCSCLALWRFRVKVLLPRSSRRGAFASCKPRQTGVSVGYRKDLLTRKGIMIIRIYASNAKFSLIIEESARLLVHVVKSGMKIHLTFTIIIRRIEWPYW